jgi:hypothetical protein
MRRAAVVLLCAFAACRTARPPNAPAIAPLTASSPAEAAQELAARRAEFRGERSLMRVRWSTGFSRAPAEAGAPSISARGQLQIDAAGRMLMTVYTPIGTSAVRLYVDGEDVIFLNDFELSAWRGKASDLVGALGVFRSTRLPLLLIGLPPADLDAITYAPKGMQDVHLADTVVTYDPAVYPPKRVMIDRGQQHIEIEHLQSYSDPQALEPPEIPRDYRCCTLPQI